MNNYLDKYKYVRDFKYSLQGVHRLQVPNNELSSFFQKLDTIQNFMIQTEKKETDKEHVHFILQSNNKGLNVYRFKLQFKEHFKKYLPSTIKNGVFNCTAVRDPVRMLIYLCKEGYPDIVHGYYTADVKEWTKLAYTKEVSMTSAVASLKKRLYNKELSLEEYIIEYRTLRNAYLHPDPNWKKEVAKAHEGMLTRQEIEQTTRNYISDFFLYNE